MAKQRYEMPYCSIGMDVLYYQDDSPSTRPLPAKIITVGSDAISVGIYDGAHEYINNKSGIRHRSDPKLKTEFNNRQGCWEHTEFNTHVLEAFGDPKRPSPEAKVPDPMGTLQAPRPRNPLATQVPPQTDPPPPPMPPVTDPNRVAA